jgi:polyferredoxin
MTQPALRRVRLLSQLVFFALFVLLLVRTELNGATGSAATLRLPHPVSLFLELNPLVAIATALSTGSLYRRLAWCLVILVPTFALGRFVCGWICPLGSLNHFFGSWKSDKKRGARLIASNRYRPWQSIKYYLLATLLVFAVFGSAVGLLLDPISLLVRSFAVVVFPGLHAIVNSVTSTLYGWPIRGSRRAADALQLVASYTVLGFRQPHFQQTFAIGLIFAAILFLNLRITRFWCRAVCPLGALLGLASRWSLPRLTKNDAACDTCNRCLLHCQGGDDPIPGAPWRKAECHLCFNCAGDCPQHALRFTLAPAPVNAADVPQLQRRKLVGSLALGAGLLPVVRGASVFGSQPEPRLIRPPGALTEPSFLERCVRCGECMKVCPTNALQPSLTEAGLEGLWTPVLVPRVGYCEPSCVLCGQVCPTGAIWEITAEEKTGRTAGNPNAAEPVKIGTAFYDRGRCLPWAMGTECLVCEEWCPTSPKAIFLVPADVVTSSGETKRIRQPYVDPKRCTGCGACEYACPVHDRPAVYVTSIGESRSRANQILLERGRRPPGRTTQGEVDSSQ